jgi:capsular exopolysaccharide synthesis family protein
VDRPRAEDDAQAQLDLNSEPDGVVSEAYRTLRTNLLHSFVDGPPRVIVLASPVAAKKHSSACGNLAVSFAHVGKRTLVVDCDLRRPFVHKLFGLRNLYGLTDVLAGGSRLQDVWQEPLPGLRVLTAGAPTPGAVDLLESNEFEALLGLMRQEFDIVLIDVPSLETVSDAAVLATKGDGVLLLLDARDTRKAPVRRAVNELRTVGANVLGTVLCDADTGR